MDHIEFSRKGGKARAAKYTKEQLSDMGRKGGRPRNEKTQWHSNTFDDCADGAL